MEKSSTSNRCADPLCHGAKSQKMVSGRGVGFDGLLHTACYQRLKKAKSRGRLKDRAGAPLPHSGPLDALDPAAASRAIREMWGDDSASTLLTK